MTLAQANNIFKAKYPTGEIFAHGFGDGSAESTAIQRTALVFKDGGKVYVYRDSYEGTLKRLGLIETKPIEVLKPDDISWDELIDLGFDF